MIYHDIEDEIEKNLLNNAISRLNPRERKIVELRYGLTNEEGEEMTQKEVADLLGISQSYISRLEKKIMKRLKKRGRQNLNETKKAGRLRVEPPFMRYGESGNMRQ